MGWQEWIRTVEIEPAIAADKAAALERQVEALLRTGCRIIHVNAPDGGALEAVDILGPLVHRYEGIVDVHLGGEDFSMVAAVGADSITFDASAVEDIQAAIEAVHGTSAQVGVAFEIEVEPEQVATDSAGADLVLCVCVGEGAVERVRRLAVLLPAGVALQVEGDVSHENVQSLYHAGARVLVADRPIFEREDLPRAYRRLVQALA